MGAGQGPPKSSVVVETVVLVVVVGPVGPAVSSALAVPIVLDHSALVDFASAVRHVADVESLQEPAHAVNRM